MYMFSTDSPYILHPQLCKSINSLVVFDIQIAIDSINVTEGRRRISIHDWSGLWTPKCNSSCTFKWHLQTPIFICDISLFSFFIIIAPSKSQADQDAYNFQKHILCTFVATNCTFSRYTFFYVIYWYQQIVPSKLGVIERFTVSLTVPKKTKLFQMISCWEMYLRSIRSCQLFGRICENLKRKNISKYEGY